ncbi:MAG: hypothetical protein H0V09_03895 [Gemmatimonadetes bacterium]|nr:hypothetical protein [Gemmatimonadota bacterium]
MSDRAPFEHVQLSAVPTIPGPGTLSWIPVRRHFGIRAFGINAYRAGEAGQDVVEDHTEGSNGHEELYVVLAGHATFLVGGEEIDAPAGTAVFIRDPAVRRAAKATEPDTMVLAVGGKPGEPYEVSAWEFWFAAESHRRAKEYDKAVEVVAAGLAHHPNHAALLYNLACNEALAGRTEEALEHLGRAIELDAACIENARSDPDLERLRSEPLFARLLSRAPKPRAEGENA